MKYFFLFLFTLFFIPHYSFAEPPDWVTNQGKSVKHPEQLYLTGFGISTVTKNMSKEDALQSAVANSRRNLIEKVRVSVSNTVSMYAEENNEHVSSNIKIATQTTSSLDLHGLKNEQYFDDEDELWYAFAFVAKEQLNGAYEEKSEHIRKEISEHLTRAKRSVDGNDVSKALKEYLSCYPLFQQLNEAQTILSVSETPFSEIEKSLQKDETTISEVNQAVDKLVQQAVNSPEDLAGYLAFCLKKQFEVMKVRVAVFPFSFQDTKMGSPFSRYFHQELTNKLSEVAKWEIVEPSSSIPPNLKNSQKGQEQSSGAEYIISGTYWEKSSGIKFLLTMRRVTDGSIVANAEREVRSEVLAISGKSLKPENFKEALSDQKYFNKDEVVGGGLEVEVFTNRGSDNLLFSEGDTMKVAIRVNMPCHIRFIYHLANGKRTPLLDDYYMDESKVNLVYELPEGIGVFECAPPFGAEILQVFARTEKFEPLETILWEGYPILKEDLGNFLVATRGMKKVSPKTMLDETRVVITTMPR